MSRYVARAAYILVTVAACPLLAWYLAVDATNHGFGSTGFLVMLLGLPVSGALLAATVLRRPRREAALGAVGAVAATSVLVAVLVFVTLSSR